MVMNIGSGVGTLTHEIVHPLVESDFPSAPTWLNEGIASVFEQPQIPRPGEIHGGKNWRWPRLKKALTTPAEKDKARLDHYFGMKDDTFRGDDEDLNYAAARYICQWMDDICAASCGLLPSLARQRGDRPDGAKRPSRTVMGMTPTEAGHTADFGRSGRSLYDARVPELRFDVGSHGKTSGAIYRASDPVGATLIFAHGAERTADASASSSS